MVYSRVDYHGVTVFNVTVSGLWKDNGTQLHTVKVKVNWNDREMYSNEFPQKNGTVPEKGAWNTTMKIWFGIPVVNDSYKISVIGSSEKHQKLFFVHSDFTPIGID